MSIWIWSNFLTFFKELWFKFSRILTCVGEFLFEFIALFDQKWKKYGKISNKLWRFFWLKLVGTPGRRRMAVEKKLHFYMRQEVLLLQQPWGGAVKALGRYPLVKFAPCHPAHSPFSLLTATIALSSSSKCVPYRTQDMEKRGLSLDGWWGHKT